MEQLKQLYKDYQAQAKKVRQSARFFDGMFGFGNDPRKNPCHEEFYEKSKEWTDTFVAGSPSPEAALEAALFLLEQPLLHKEEDCYMYMFVGVGFIDPMIPFLGKENCAAVAKRMNELYPRRERLPLQAKVLKNLQAAAK